MKLGHSLALDGIGFTDQLPKTRGRKIVRRLLREIVTSNGAPVGDVTTLEDMNVLKNLASQQDED